MGGDVELNSDPSLPKLGPTPALCQGLRRRALPAFHDRPSHRTSTAAQAPCVLRRHPRLAYHGASPGAPLGLPASRQQTIAGADGSRWASRTSNPLAPALRSGWWVRLPRAPASLRLESPNSYLRGRPHRCCGVPFRPVQSRPRVYSLSWAWVHRRPRWRTSSGTSSHRCKSRT